MRRKRIKNLYQNHVSYILGAFAVFALGSGIASLIYGVLLLLRYISIEYNYGIFNLFSTSILLIVVGGLLIIAVLLGVFGALKDISNVRLVTLVLLFILFAILGKKNFSKKF